MSDHDEVMERLEWCVTALKYLLSQSAGYQPEGQVEDYENDEEPEPVLVEVSPPEQAACTHGQQAKRGDAIVCAKCGYVIIPGTGIGGTASQHGAGPV